MNNYEALPVSGIQISVGHIYMYLNRQTQRCNHAFHLNLSVIISTNALHIQNIVCQPFYRNYVINNILTTLNLKEYFFVRRNVLCFKVVKIYMNLFLKSIPNNCFNSIRVCVHSNQDEQCI